MNWNGNVSRAVVLGLAALGMGCSSAVNPPPDAGQGECLTQDPGPAGEFLYLANGTSNEVSVVDPRNCSVVATIPVGKTPAEANASPDGRYVFTANSDTNNVSVIDTQTNTVVKTLEVGTRPVHVFWNPAHTKLWVRNDGSASVSVIDLATLTVERTISTGSGHGKMAFDESSPYRVYVSNITDGTVSVIETTGYTVMATVTVGPGPHGMDYSSVSKNVYNCSGGAPAGIDVIATQGLTPNTVVKRIELPSACNYIHFSPDNRYGWAPMRNGNAVAVIDAQTDTLVGTVPVGDKPDKVGFFGSVAVVTNVRSPDVSLIDMNTTQELVKIGVGNGKWDEAAKRGHRAIGESLDHRHAYVPNGADGTLTIVDTQTRAVRSTLTVGTGPNGMAVAGPSGGRAYPR